MRGPNQSFVELTQKCNINCKHCFANAADNENHMTVEVYQKVLNELYDMGVIHIGLTGGETLLNPQFNEIISLSEQYMKAQSFVLLTNGTLWEDATFTNLQRNGVNLPISIQISFDGPDYATYQQFRGGEEKEFNKIVETIKKAVNHNFYTTAFFAATDKNLKYAFDTARFALEEMKVSSFLVAPLFVSGRARDNFDELEFLQEEWKEFVIKATEIKRDRLWGDYSDRFRVNFFTLYEFILPLLEAGMEEEIKSVWGYEKELLMRIRNCYCEAARTDMAVDWTGQVFPCVPAMRTEFVAGDLTRHSLKQIWQESSILKWFREAHEEVIKHEPCKSCTIKDFCGGGCRLSAYYLTGDKYAPDPRCPLVKKG